VTPELFVMPTPLMVNVKPGLAVMVKGLRRAFESNTIPLTSVFSEIERSVVLDKSKKAVSDGPFGTVVGIQLAPVFQSPEPGLRAHIALPPWADPTRKSIRPQPTTGAISLFLKRNSALAVLR